ncbi:MAG: branched-chain amino acid ABC transporter permease [Acetobacteraceae bacterium]
MSEAATRRRPRTHKRDMRGAATLTAGLAILLALPLFLNDYTQYIANAILVYSLAGLGFNIVLGYLGQLAFINAAFFGLGAYATALGMRLLGIPFWLMLPPAAAIGAAAGVLTALPALRLKRYYLAIVTMTLSELLRWVYVHSDVTGGASGLAVPDGTIFGISLDSGMRKYFVYLAVTIAIYASTRALLRSRFGRAIAAVRQNEAAAASLGIEPARVKLIAFAWSGAIVAIAGALFSILLGRIDPTGFDLSQLLLQFAIVMIGGLGSLAGSAIGALLLTGAPELLRNLPGLEEIAFALLLIVVLIFVPEGLGGIIARRVPALADRFHGGRT